ncbi:MAG: hypothetical protein ACM3TR_02520 [Caulobacteraceae bacterium]
MISTVRLSVADYQAYAHAMTGDFGLQGESMSKIEYYVNLRK